MNALTAEAAVELRLGEKCTRQTQDLVCLTQLTVFSLQRLDALFFSAGRAWALAGVALSTKPGAFKPLSKCASHSAFDAVLGRNS